MPRPFLTAHWRRLVFANYPVDEALLRSILPDGLEPDRWEGQCWLSLVGFQFLRTRVLGIGWPGYRDFTEWNLRAYVRRAECRGVIFVREFVPKRLVAAIARYAYNEPYAAAPVESIQHPSHSIRYRVQYADRWHELNAMTTGNTQVPQPDSMAAFFTDQKWGFGRSKKGNLERYSVHHPMWAVETIQDYSVDLDWVTLYGTLWKPMNGTAPASVLYADGSDVAVYPAERKR